MRALVVIAAIAGAPALVAADPPADDPAPDVAPGEADTDNRVNLRIGGSTADANGRPVVCAEVAITWGISVEGCGTGSGFLHTDDGGEIAHFRLNKRIWGTRLGRGRVQTAGGLGFAELEVGEDSAGFDFGSPGGVAPTSVAGPEASLSARYLAPLGRGFEFLANASLGLAWFSGAPDLVAPQERLQPFASFELGVGW